MKRIFWTFLLFIAFACSREDQIPEGVLAENKMISFMKDAYLAETKVKNLHLSKDSSLVLFRHFELALYDKHGISEEQFTESYNFYLQHPEMLEELNGAVLDSLGVMESLLMKEKTQSEEEE